MLRLFTTVLLLLALASPIQAAETRSGAENKADTAKTGESAKATDKSKTDSAKSADKTDTAKNADDRSAKTDGKDASDKEQAEEQKDPNVFECKYYTVTLPQGWIAVTPPTENQGMVTSIFKSTNGGIVINLVFGKLGGESTKTIADMFAEQFKAEKPPVEKNGQYTFTFMRDNEPCDAYVSSSDDIFMVTTIAGNRKEALSFIRNQVKSGDYGKLLPQ